MRMNSLGRLGRTAIAIALFASCRIGHAGMISATVDSQSGPWDQSSNPGFDYGTHDNNGPKVITTGITFTAGSTLTIAYASGLTSAYGGTPYSDAGGDTAFTANDSPGNSTAFFPSYYMGPYPPSPSPSDVFLNELVGAFADASGVIVGTGPFAIGNLGTFVIPNGASALLLGFNDDIFSDNTGAITVTISGDTVTSVPEPSSMALAGLGGLGLAVAGYRRRKRAAV